MIIITNYVCMCLVMSRRIVNNVTEIQKIWSPFNIYEWIVELPAGWMELPPHRLFITATAVAIFIKLIKKLQFDFLK